MHLYLHIPFCKQACHYCDFHFSTTQKNKEKLVRAMMTELERRKDELKSTELTTIYFGGGTPSVLDRKELDLIFNGIQKHFSISSDAEITLEANPDDLTKDYLRALKQTPVNRFSIGVQSFREEDLKMMNRAHNAAEAERAIHDAQEAGFSNLTIDLIYGIPGLSDEEWKNNIEKAMSFGVPHISAYCLTVEAKTALAHFVKQGKIKPVDESVAESHFRILSETLTANGYSHYEISNFGKEGFIAKHNSSYWFGEPYLGIGPSAHSYDGTKRRWNIANNAQYISRIEIDEPAFEEETLDEKNNFNEFVLTRLRTMWGIRKSDLEARFSSTFVKTFTEGIQPWIEGGKVLFFNENWTLTNEGKLFADRIASDLFIV